MKNDSFYLGIDIGGTSAKYAVVDISGNLFEQGSFKTGRSMTQEQLIGEIFTTIEKVKKFNIIGVGIATLGIVDVDRGMVMTGAENLPVLNGLPLKQMIESRYDKMSVSLINDARSAALGESWLGGARDYSNYFMITLGTGIGGVLCADGQIINGQNFRTGEIGYLDYNNENDYLETKYATQSIVEEARKQLELDRLDGKGFIERVEDGCPISSRLLEVWMDQLARVIANIVIVIDPGLILIGGGISARGDLLIPMIKQRLVKYIPATYIDQFEIKTATLGNDAGLIGSVRPLIEKGLNNENQI